ncbi:bacteriohemerythrin [Xylophilus sp. ASV27]|uniref:bacteriohemerythrin n=1 Tax=Xylophilus sp. ASV27 TaxID=2795129 RepID=UPI0018EDD243|nr:hemerythrin [Xylophilus sp. ASV27]
MATPLQPGALAHDLPFMDNARAEFMKRLAIADQAGDAQLPAAWRNLVACAAETFSREDLWMHSTGFSTRRDHMLQHRVVLGVMREGIVQAEAGHLPQVRQMVWELRDWYDKHVQSADAALALHLRGKRFKPANERLDPASAQTSPARS